MRLALLAVSLLFVSLAAWRSAPERRVQRVALTLPAADVAALQAKGFEILVVDPEGAWADVVSPPTAGHLPAHGLEVLRDETLDGRYGPDDRYKTPAEVEQILKGYAAAHPQIVTLKAIGKSLEGRDIWAVRLTHDGYAGIVTKPVVLLNAMHHAREVMSTEVALDAIEQLVSRFNQDEAVTRWLAEAEIWVVPMLNVDGSQLVWTRDAMWRKNARGGYGVDINRNYPAEWGACNGSSGDRRSDTYRGEAPASEPETKALMGLVAEIKPVASISYHSYGEMVLYPFGCNGQRTPRTDLVEGIGKELAKRLPRENGRGTYKAGTSWELLYAVDGADTDWMYTEHHVLPFVVELGEGFAGGGFQPPFARRDELVEGQRAGWGYVLDRVLATGIRGRVTDVAGAPVAGAKIEVEKVAGAGGAGKATYPAHADGSFHVVLDPGAYRVTAVQGGRKHTVDVTLGESRRHLVLRL